MAQTRYTEATTLTSIITTELNSLADDAAAVDSDELSNDASTERNLYANFGVTIATQTARTSGADNKISLLLIPEGYSDNVYADAIADGDVTSIPYIARDASGQEVTWVLDDAVTDRELAWSHVLLPNGNFKVGILNRSSQALATSGNIVYMSGTYSTTYI